MKEFFHQVLGVEYFDVKGYMLKKTKHIFKKIVKALLFPVLRTTGFQKRIILLDVGNWFGLPWSELFRTSWKNCLRFELKTYYLGNLLRAGEEIRVDVDWAYYRSVHFEGFNLWELSKCGILASLETSFIKGELGEREKRVIQFYYDRIARVLTGARKIIDSDTPISVITVQGSNATARPMLEVAREKGIHVAAVEGSFLADYFFCDDATGMIVNRHRGACLDGHWIESRALTDAQRAAFRHQLTEAREQKRDEHRTGSDETNGDIRQQLGIAKDRKIAVLIGQVLTDAAVVMDSKVFRDPVDWISEAIAYFAERPDWFLVVRLHPKESFGVSWANLPEAKNGYGVPPGEPEGPLPYNDLTYRKLMERGLPERSDGHVVLKDRSIATDDIVEEADLGLTLTSQAGFEMVLKYKRVVVSGDAFFAGKGFTIDVVRRSGFRPALDDALGNLELSEMERCAVDRFGDHMLRSVLFRKDLKDCRKRLFKTITGIYP